jgi:hypothetical protein
MKEGELLEIPEFDDIYASSEVCIICNNAALIIKIAHYIG